MHFVRLFTTIYNNLSPKHQLESLRVLVLLLSNSVIDVFGISMIIPVIISFEKEKFMNNEILMKIYLGLEVESFQSFQIFLLIFLVLIFVFKNILALYSLFRISKFSFSVSEYFANKQINKNFDLDYLKFKKENSNDIVRDSIVIPAEFSSQILIPGLSYFNEFLVSVIIITCLIFYDPLIFIITILALSPGILFTLLFTKKKVRNLGKLKDLKSTGPYKFLFMGIFTFLDMKLYKTNSFFLSKTLKKLRSYYSVLVKLTVFETIPLRVIEISSILTIALILLVCNFALERYEDLINILIVYATASYRLMPSINRALSLGIRIKGAEYTVEKLMSNSNIIKEQKPEKNSKLLFNHSISLLNISYAYENEKILDKISFIIKKGQIIRISGESGSGKTTLVNIISRIIDDNTGSIKIDGINIDKSNTASWQNMIAYVPQEFYIREGTIRNNIAFAIEEALIDDSLIIDCIEKVNLQNFLAQNNYDLNTDIQEFGGNISGGQRQRMAIARALYRQPKLLIFDEATNALDSQTEDQIFLTLDRLRKNGLTIIVISHRTDSSFKYSKSFNIKKGER